MVCLHLLACFNCCHLLLTILLGITALQVQEPVMGESLRHRRLEQATAVAATVTASGKMLKPLAVLKGKPGACIETREFLTYPANNAYDCQQTAWMDERVMLLWVRRTILKPFIEDCPDNIQPLMLLDSYKQMSNDGKCYGRA